jgi:hypothetical protein
MTQALASELVGGDGGRSTSIPDIIGRVDRTVSDHASDGGFWDSSPMAIEGWDGPPR